MIVAEGPRIDDQSVEGNVEQTEQREQGPKTPENAEELATQIQAERAAVQAEADAIAKTGQERLAVVTADPDVDQKDAAATGVEVNALGEEARNVTAEATAQLDKVVSENSEAPEINPPPATQTVQAPGSTFRITAEQSNAVPPIAPMTKVQGNERATTVDDSSPAVRIENAEPDPGEMENDPRFRQLVQEASLAYLKTKDASWFYREYSGKVAPSGYLINRQGKETNFLPSQNISVGIVEVEKRAREQFAKLYPEDASRYEKKATGTQNRESATRDTSKIQSDGARHIGAVQRPDGSVDFSHALEFTGQSKDALEQQAEAGRDRERFNAESKELIDMLSGYIYADIPQNERAKLNNPDSTESQQLQYYNAAEAQLRQISSLPEQHTAHPEDYLAALELVSGVLQNNEQAGASDATNEAKGIPADEAGKTSSAEWSRKMSDLSRQIGRKLFPGANTELSGANYQDIVDQLADIGWSGRGKSYAFKNGLDPTHFGDIVEGDYSGDLELLERHLDSLANEASATLHADGLSEAAEKVADKNYPGNPESQARAVKSAELCYRLKIMTDQLKEKVYGDKDRSSFDIQRRLLRTNKQIRTDYLGADKAEAADKPQQTARTTESRPAQEMPAAVPAAEVPAVEPVVEYTDEDDDTEEIAEDEAATTAGDPSAKADSSTATEQGQPKVGETGTDKQPTPEQKQKLTDQELGTAMLDIRHQILSGVDEKRANELGQQIISMLAESNNQYRLIDGAMNLSLLKRPSEAKPLLRRAEENNVTGENAPQWYVAERSCVIARLSADSGDLDGARESLQKALQTPGTENKDAYKSAVKTISKQSSVLGKLFSNFRRK